MNPWDAGHAAVRTALLKRITDLKLPGSRLDWTVGAVGKHSMQKRATARRRGTVWGAIGACAAMVLALLSGFALPASAAGAVSITVTSNPNPVATGQSIAYTITVVNTGVPPHPLPRSPMPSLVLPAATGAPRL